MSEIIHSEALINLLDKKGIISKQECMSSNGFGQIGSKINVSIPHWLHDFYKRSFKGKPFTIVDVNELEDKLNNDAFRISNYYSINTDFRRAV